MTQRLISLLIISCWFVVGLAIAAPANPGGQVKKTPETSFQQGLDCLKQTDVACAKLALNSIPSQSLYAKLLAGNIAVAEGDIDQAFRLLLPLQAAQNLTPRASASLHASLAQAYDKQADPLRALEQRILLDQNLMAPADDAAILANQQQILDLLAGLPQSQLVDMRGESVDTTMQGWIDLALALRSPSRKSALNSWRLAYPDLGVSQSLLQQLDQPQADNAGTVASVQPASELQGPIALILPFAVADFYPAADAIERGFVAAQTQAKGDDAIKMYATHGNAAEIAGIYQQAIAEGAKYVVGPLTRDEVSALTTLPIPVPTLALNEPESLAANPQLHALGLSVEAEAAQVADLARSYGMQTAIIVASDNPLGSHMANAFSEAWIKQGGQIKLQAVITRMSDLEDLKAQIADQPADMIFLAADAAEARAIRPHLDIATPTFALSHVYSGLPHDPLDKPLLAVRFVDMPWLLNPDDPAFAAYKAAASDLPPGKMQRWFALGVDAYQLLQELVRHPGQPFSINGLTGKINVSADGAVSRELATGSFGSNGIVLENTP